jgi:hypothetical protein
MKTVQDTSVQFVNEASGITGFKIADPAGESFHKKSYSKHFD